LASSATIFNFSGQGWDGSAYQSGCSMQFIAFGLWSGSNRGAQILFKTTPTGTTGFTNAAAIQASGGFAIGATSIATDSGIGTLAMDGKVARYNAIVTAGWGVPAIQAAGRFTAQTAAKAVVASYTVGAADGSFEVSANILVTTATAHSFTVTCAYTDEGNTARTLTFGFTQLSGATFLTAITNVTGVGPYESPVLHIRCKASSTITIATTGTFTTVTYNVEGIIKQTA
jgi:hypothetical protein